MRLPALRKTYKQTSPKLRLKQIEVQVEFEFFPQLMLTLPKEVLKKLGLNVKTSFQVVEVTNATEAALSSWPLVKKVRLGTDFYLEMRASDPKAEVPDSIELFLRVPRDFFIAFPTAEPAKAGISISNTGGAANIEEALEEIDSEIDMLGEAFTEILHPHFDFALFLSDTNLWAMPTTKILKLSSSNTRIIVLYEKLKEQLFRGAPQYFTAATPVFDIDEHDRLLIMLPHTFSEYAALLSGKPVNLPVFDDIWMGEECDAKTLLGYMEDAHWRRQNSVF